MSGEKLVQNTGWKIKGTLIDILSTRLLARPSSIQIGNMFFLLTFKIKKKKNFVDLKKKFADFQEFEFVYKNKNL